MNDQAKLYKSALELSVIMAGNLIEMKYRIYDDNTLSLEMTGGHISQGLGISLKDVSELGARNVMNADELEEFLAAIKAKEIVRCYGVQYALNYFENDPAAIAYILKSI